MISRRQSDCWSHAIAEKRFNVVILSPSRLAPRNLKSSDISYILLQDLLGQGPPGSLGKP